MNAMESLAAYFMPRRQRERGPSSVESAIAASDDLVETMRSARTDREVHQKAAIEARRGL